MNFMRTAVLLAGMTALFLVVGLLLGGRGGMGIALVFAIGANIFAYWNSDSMALRAVDAREIDRAAAPDLVDDVAMLASRAGLPTPRVCLVDSPQPNAFATGRDPDHAAIAVNTGLSAMLTREERLGVLAHEMSHIKHRDTLTMTIAATLAGAISSIAHWGMFFGAGRRQNGPGPIAAIGIAILAPMAAMIVQMAVSRSREYEADRSGGQLCGNPLWLASALGKIATAAHAIPDEAVEQRPAMAHLFIVNPLAGGFRDNLFSTHPDTANRIEALVRLAAEMGIDAHSAAQQPAPEPRAQAPSGGWSPFRQPSPAPAAAEGSFLGGRGVARPAGGPNPWAAQSGDGGRPDPWGRG
ncbi:MAG: zinc metalloprotease HtpX [Hyphomicrobiales bacterium]|nr:zinc metalloprotease HtpX [Hyphomicrobiales bacterium]